MKIRDAIDQLLPKQKIERRYEVHHQWRAAGKEHGICPPHRLERRSKQQEIGPNSPT